MKSRFCVLIISIFMGLHSNVYGVDLIEGFPTETVLLRLPENMEKNWKEINRYVNKKQGIIESIPLDQTVQNWTDLICIAYYSKSVFSNKKVVQSVDAWVNKIRSIALSGYPDDIATWKIIEKNENDVIYESILHKTYSSMPAQSEIARAFLTDSGAHRVGFTKKNALMSTEEKKKWIKILKENTSVVPFDGHSKPMELSMVDHVVASFELGDEFSDWQLANNFVFDNGHVLRAYIPPSQEGASYISECLEITTKPNVTEISMNDFFESEKSEVFNKNKRKTKFKVLHESPEEITYCYSQPQDHLQVNAVVRTLVNDYGYYSISYRTGIKGDMEKEDVLRWEEKLKAIPIKSLKNNQI
jgi:hypothetical protein